MTRCIISSMSINNLYTGKVAAEIDRIAINNYRYQGYELMKQAGRLAFDHLQATLSSLDRTAKILVLCGSGNNGGDGYVLGRCALQAGWSVSLSATNMPTSEESKQAKDQFLKEGGVVQDYSASNVTGEYDAVVDALLGIGLRSAPKGEVGEAIELANSLNGFKLALDVPSGVDADTGGAFKPCFSADLTVTFIANKIGLNTGPALNYVGELRLEGLGVVNEVFSEVKPLARLISKPRLPQRQRNSHKGNYGHVVIAGADTGMLGAVLLAGEAALRAGGGKVTVLSTPGHLDQPALYRPELMSATFIDVIPDALKKVNAVAIGPGLGTGDWGLSLLNEVLALNVATVIDADALTLLAANKQQLPANCVLTPHPGEAARLLAAASQDIQADRATAAVKIAQQYGAVCVLKGAGTLVATPAGQLYLCGQGNPAMATAGMGDVLTGMIGALLGQGYHPHNAACTAVSWHAATADRLVYEQQRYSLVASEVAKALSQTS